jgi:hypothetical protein
MPLRKGKTDRRMQPLFPLRDGLRGLRGSFERPGGISGHGRICCLVVVLAFAAGAARAPLAGARPSVGLRTAIPGSVRINGMLHVNGTIHGGGGAQRVVLQKRASTRWVPLAGARVERGGGFHLGWRASRDPAILVVRVVAFRGTSARAATAARGLRISAPVRVLAVRKIRSVPAPGSTGVVRLGGHATAAPGDVIAAGISSTSPDGFLGEVVSVEHLGGETAIHTKPISLIAAVPEGSIDAAIDSSRGLASTSAARPSAVAKTAGAGLHESIAKNFSCSGSVSASLGGSVSLTTSADFHAHWSLFHGVDKASFTGTATASAELGASVAGSASCTLAKTALLARPWTLTPIEVQVGPIPVVLVPRVQVFVSAAATVNAAVKTGVHGSISATAGLNYDRGAISPIAANSLTFGYEPPTLSSSASISGHVIPTLDLLFYGVAGPEISFSAGLDLAANPARDPWWTLTAPVDLNASLKIPELGLSTGEVHVYHHSFPIAQAPLRPPPPPPPPPPPLPPPATRSLGYFNVSPDLACTLLASQDLKDEFFTGLEASNDACGTFLVVDGELFGPAAIPAGEDLGGYNSWAPVEQTFSGQGTGASPFREVTVVEAGATGVRLTQIDRWEEGGTTVHTDYSVSGEPGDQREVRLYRAADCYVGESDFGFGTFDQSSQAVGCLRTDPAGGEFQEQLRPLSPAGATSTEGFYGEIWSDVATQQPLADTCRCGEEIDDGVATSWGLNIQGVSPVSASSQFAFVPGG